MTAAHHRALALLAVVVLAGACSTAKSASTTTTENSTGKVSVAVLSRLGPFGEDKVVGAGSLAQLRSALDCGAPTARCWPDAQTVPEDLLLAVSVQACQPVVSVTGLLRAGNDLLVSVNHSKAPSGRCAAALPVLWLLGIPLAQLPQQGSLSVAVEGGAPDAGDLTTSVQLPISTA